MSVIQSILARLQPLGRALMLPIAVLPVAALLLRLGQPDMFDIGFVAAAGGAIFSNLGLLFAAGVAVGLARENHGAAALAGVVAYLVATEGAKTLLILPPGVAEIEAAAWRTSEIAKLSVPAGILAGIVAGLLYNRFANIKLPDYLAFFAGRRFVPIVAGLAGVAGAALFGLGFPWFESGVDAISQWVVQAGSVGLFLYGLLNRLLLVTGLHHIINNLAWFLLGEYDGATGDLQRFFAGDPQAGAFMTGYFPVMMFGLPAACLAMYRNALPERRKEVGGLLLSLALTSFLTGVTEPIEFSFIFLAPLLYLVHAVLTGLSMVLMDALGVKLGFGFSAGLFDYLLNFGLSTRPLLLLPVGVLYALVYYATFSWCIRRFHLKTPGREDEAASTDKDAPAGSRGQSFAAALGGCDNLASVDACTTRLRLVLHDPQAIDETALKRLGARGVVRPGAGSVQVILGPIADQVAGEIRSAASTEAAARSPARKPLAAPAAEIADRSAVDAQPEEVSAEAERLAGAVFELLHESGITAVMQRSSRLVVELERAPPADLAPLVAAGLRAAVQSSERRLHLVVGPHVSTLATALERRLSYP